MKITFEEALSRGEWIHKELMNSLSPEVINKAIDDRFYEVKLLVNGVELEPKYFNHIMDNLDAYISAVANEILINKLEEAKNKVNKLSEYIDKISNNIIDVYGLDREDFN